MTRRCVFCKRKIVKGGNGNDILHHTTPKFLVKKSWKKWIENKQVPKETKELLLKSRTPLCKRCHKVFHGITLHLVEIIKSSDLPDVPPDRFIDVLRGVDAKYGGGLK